jgi:carboxyl-terminal processing protease
MRQAAGAQTPADTYPAIQAAIALLGNPHSMLLPPQSAQGGVAVPGTGPPGRVPTGMAVTPDLGYVLVPGIFGSEQTVLEYARIGAAVVEEFDRAARCGWIVDLREDDGGNMWPMMAVLAPLLGAGTLGYFEDADGHRTAWGVRDGTPVLGDRPLYPELHNGYRLRRTEPSVAVLTGPKTTSSGEATLIAFKGRADTRVFGQPTAGLASANEGFTLSDGATLLLTTANDVDRPGRVYGNTPIPPNAPPSDSAADDPVRQAATAWLRQHHACRAPGQAG